MKIKELIEKLQGLDPELSVYVAGYEGGYHDADVSRPYPFKFWVNKEWWYGPHEVAETGEMGIIIKATAEPQIVKE